jgi:hypothetical protein
VNVVSALVREDGKTGKSATEAGDSPMATHDAHEHGLDVRKLDIAGTEVVCNELAAVVIFDAVHVLIEKLG